MFDDPINGKTDAFAPAPPANINNLKPAGGINQSVAGASAGENNQPPIVEDIFKETENIEKPAVFAPKESGSPTQGIQDVDNIIHARLSRKIVVGLVVFTGVLLLVYASYWGYTWWKNRETPEFIQTDMNAENNQLVPADAENQVKSEISPDDNAAADANQAPAVGSGENISESSTANMADSDQDGLSDMEEIELRTDINNTDSDQDGLFDREETRVYQTNPLNPDTDGDSFLDGSEVRGGYNPNGPGKLYEIQK